MNENDKLTVQKIEYEIKIRTLLAQMAQLKTLENLGLQMSQVQSAIFAGYNYGFKSQSYVFTRLLDFLNGNKIRALYGTCQEVYVQSQQPRFTCAFRMTRVYDRWYDRAHWYRKNKN
jgi:hypothetical protein